MEGIEPQDIYREPDWNKMTYTATCISHPRPKLAARWNSHMLELLFLVYSAFNAGGLYVPYVAVGAADRGWHLIVNGGQDLLRNHLS